MANIQMAVDEAQAPNIKHFHRIQTFRPLLLNERSLNLESQSILLSDSP